MRRGATARPMTLLRTIVVLAGALAVMLLAVILRAETTRLHYEISQCERQADDYRRQLHAAELELARLRNPMMIREKVEEAVRRLIDEDAPPEPPPPRHRGR